jgi:hypothetical protein
MTCYSNIQEIFIHISCKTFLHFLGLLHLALAIVNKFCSTAANGRLASLLDLGLEEDLVALLPGLGYNSLAWVDSAGETNLDVLEGAVPEKVGKVLC